MLGLGLSIPQVAARGSRSLVAAIRSLFATNEPGVWFDPSDLSTLFQDAAGSTPVTAVEQPVGLILDKSKGLVLVTNGDFSEGLAGWSQTGTTWSPAGGTAKNDGTAGYLYKEAIVTVGAWVVVECTVADKGTAGSLSISLSNGGATASFSSASLVNGQRVSVRGVKTFNESVYFFGQGGWNGAIDNISVRELPGNHAYQTTATSRPVLSARVNLLTKTEQFDNSAWLKSYVFVTANTTTAPDGTNTASRVAEGSGAISPFVQAASVSIQNGLAYTFSFFAKADQRNFVQATFSSSTHGSGQYANFDLATGAVTASVGGTASIVGVGAGWYRCSFTATATSTGTAGPAIGIVSTGTSSRLSAYTGDGTSGIYIWGADLRVANDGANLPPYQRVNTATDYDTAGFPHYLRVDGVDDGMVTNSIDFSSTDKLTVCAGVRKLSDAVYSFVAEHGIGGADARAATMITAPRSPTNLEYRSQIRDGTYVTESTSISRPAPDTAVHTHELDYAKPWLGKVKYRINGTAVISTEQGTGAATGNFGNYPLYLFRRGSSNPFNGRFYGMLIVGRLLSGSELRSTEKYINTKTRAY